MKKMERRSLRQGDVAFFQVEKLPKEAQFVSRELKIVGETNKHCHEMDHVSVYSIGVLEEESQRTFVVIPEIGVEMTHQEHPPLSISQGIYEVRRAREYPDQPVD